MALLEGWCQDPFKQFYIKIRKKKLKNVSYHVLHSSSLIIKSKLKKYIYLIKSIFYKSLIDCGFQIKKLKLMKEK